MMPVARPDIRRPPTPAAPPPLSSSLRCNRRLPRANPSLHSGTDSSSQSARTPAIPLKGTTAAREEEEEP